MTVSHHPSKAAHLSVVSDYSYTTVSCVDVKGLKETPVEAAIFHHSLENFFHHLSPLGHQVFIEHSSYAQAPTHFTRYTDTEDFFIFSVITDSAAKSSLAHELVTFLHKTLPIEKNIGPNVTTAIHEALQNAIIHGNCGIHSSFKDINDFEKHYRLFEECLSNPVYGHRRITIEVGISSNNIVVAVTDEGKGYISSIQGKAQQQKPHGLGLEVISRYCSKYNFLPGGNTLMLWFDLQAIPMQESADYQRKKLKESLRTCKILLVDDVDFNLMILGEILFSHGFFNFQRAKNGKEALEKTLSWRPDLVILDLIMPEMDGFQYCRAVRSHPELKDIPVVVQTALNMPEQRTKAFEEGATDFISKPIDPDEMIARVLVHLERHTLFNDLETSRRRMAEELEGAKAMQQILLPSEEQVAKIKKNYEIDIYGHFQTSSELGGDFWGIRPLSPTQIALYLVDFSGHGITAALNTFRLHTLMNEHTIHDKDPGAYLTHLNEGISQLLPSGQFATMFYAVIDTRENTLSYATASPPKPLILRQESRTIETLENTGFPLGIQTDFPYITGTTGFYPGDTLCLYSDALIETENSKGDFFKEEDLCHFLEHTAQSSEQLHCCNIFHALVSYFNTYYAPNVTDDLTITFFQRHNPCE